MAETTDARASTDEKRGVPLPAKIAIWFVAAVAILALLWFVVFPWMENLLPAEF